ncbi:MAG: hypothetical protein P8Y96_00805 [Desulfuromonadales bacterium]
MTKTMDTRKSLTLCNIMDALLYLLAFSAMANISISFLLWLRF